MARIFINYRRDDTQGVAGRLFDYLASKYSRDELFMDVDAMQPGLDFAKQLDTQVSQCHVLLAVIGPHWIEAHDQAGHRRLDNDKDSVRVELASALQRDIAVIPVLVDGAVMPPEDSLPDNLKALSRRHAIELRHTRFNADADAIAHALERVVPRSRIPWRFVAPGAVVAVAVVIAAVLWPKLAHKPVPQPAVAVSTVPGIAAPPAATAPAVSAPPIQPPALQPPAAKPAAPAFAPAATVPVLPPATKAPVEASANPTDGLPPNTKLGVMLPGTNLKGSNWHYVDIQNDDPANCQHICRLHTECAAWTYVSPKTPGQAGRCFLKQVIPEQFEDSCCTSGIEQAPIPEYRVPPAVPPTVAGALRGIDFFGGGYGSTPGSGASIDACQQACKGESLCVAWTYVRAGVIGPDGICSLKSSLSTVVHSTCCVSGAQILQNTDLSGSDYRKFDPAPADATQCQDRCRKDNQCTAWTYVQPGAQGASARCYLKNSIPQPKPKPCCTSGIERADTK